MKNIDLNLNHLKIGDKVLIHLMGCKESFSGVIDSFGIRGVLRVKDEDNYIHTITEDEIEKILEKTNNRE